MEGIINKYIVGAYSIVVSKIPHYLYFKKGLRKLLPKYLAEQYTHRLYSAEPCVMNGSCLVCGCTTPGLMFAPKACEDDCYPKLMSRAKWKTYKAKLSKGKQERIKNFYNN